MKHSTALLLVMLVCLQNGWAIGTPVRKLRKVPIMVSCRPSLSGSSTSEVRPEKFNCRFENNTVWNVGLLLPISEIDLLTNGKERTPAPGLWIPTNSKILVGYSLVERTGGSTCLRESEGRVMIGWLRPGGTFSFSLPATSISQAVAPSLEIAFDWDYDQSVQRRIMNAASRKSYDSDEWPKPHITHRITIDLPYVQQPK